MPNPKYFFDLNQTELSDLLVSLGEPTYRSDQVWQGMYNHLAAEPDAITTLSKELRKKISEHLVFSHLRSSKRMVSTDRQTVKTLFDLPDNKAIEAVLMRYDQRQTLCISSQAGCAMNCVFCATGQMGFGRNLTSGEIVEQVMFFARELATESKVVTNIVVMGMGEPFHNYDAVIEAIDRLNDPHGFNLGARRFTISTVGLPPMIDRFAQEKRQVNLAISLHAANDTLRSSLLPINQKYPIADLMQSCRNYIALTNRRLTFEWALIQGVNDSTEDARQLSHLVRGMLCHVNVIPLNPTQNFSGQPTTRERAEVFKSTLESAGVSCTIRLRRGIDIQAGCGQLASQQQI